MRVNSSGMSTLCELLARIVNFPFIDFPSIVASHVLAAIAKVTTFPFARTFASGRSWMLSAALLNVPVRSPVAFFARSTATTTSVAGA